MSKPPSAVAAAPATAIDASLHAARRRANAARIHPYGCAGFTYSPLAFDDSTAAAMNVMSLTPSTIAGNSPPYDGRLPSRGGSRPQAALRVTIGAGPDRKLMGIQRARAADAVAALEEEAAVGATNLAKIVKFSMAALVLAVALVASGAMSAQQRSPTSHPAAPAPGSHGPTLGPGPASCDLGPTLPQPPTFGDAADAVKDISKATEDYIRDCSCATQACIAAALDQYAQALAQIAPRLPPHLQNAAGIVATAAGRARVAHTKAEALRAVHDAIAAIHKDIELVRAEDPGNPRATRGGDFVAETLNVASLALEKGGGL
jgi:hypothetical protein